MSGGLLRIGSVVYHNLQDYGSGKVLRFDHVQSTKKKGPRLVRQIIVEWESGQTTTCVARELRKMPNDARKEGKRAKSERFKIN